MKVFRDRAAPSKLADPTTFVGHATTQRLAVDDDPPSVHVYRVDFADGARTNWHIHSGSQWLFVVEGSIRVQRAGEAAQDVGVGDAVLFSPGEKHWHGATPGSRGVHIAVNINATTEWFEPVSEEQYLSG